MTGENRTAKKLLGELLLEKGLINKEQLWEVLREQSRTGELLGSILIRTGMVSEQIVHDLLGSQKIKLEQSQVDPEALKVIPENLIRKYKVIPLKQEKDCLTLAMADPINVLAIDNLRVLTGYDIKPVQAGEKFINNIIQKHFGILEVERIFDEFEFQTIEQDQNEKKEENSNQAPVVRLVNSIIFQAIEQDASDIHVEPQEHFVRIRYRIDGMLREITTLPGYISPSVVTRIKIMSEMDIAEKRLPQDGRIQICFETREFDLRVSTLPTIFGEKVVIRLLDKKNIDTYNINYIGFNLVNQEKFNRALKNVYGMILITGPTGSGKTTTLYAGLNELNSDEKNIVTIENPVEYMLNGINQTQVNIKAGMSFAAGLRAILRQDPDVIMVGEIRDSETAEIAVQAATTGHLVLSTIHTNDACGALTRLVDMGIEPFLVASSVLLVVAQRLVRTICPECRQSYDLEKNTLGRCFIGIGPDDPVTLYRGAGCEFCGGTGYRGRVAIHEVLTMTGKIRSLLINNPSTYQIKQQAITEGLVDLKTDGIEKMFAGLTTINEVIRVAHVDE